MSLSTFSKRRALIPRLIYLILATFIRIQTPAVAQDRPALTQAALPDSYYSVPSPDDDDCLIPPITTLKSIFEGFEEHREKIAAGQPGANANERSMWGTISFKIADPKKYNHIHSLDNDDPSRFWYTLRPNLFNIDVPDEWDYINLINTDRSDFTDTPVSAGKGVSMLETGFTYTQVLMSTSHTEIRTLPEALLRYGITDEFELRVKTLGYSMIDEKNTQTGQSGAIFGMNDIDIGFKYEIFQQRNWIPITTLVTGALLPSGTNGISGNSVQPHFNLVNGWQIRRWIFLKHQFGMDYLTQPGFSVGGGGSMTGPYGLVGSRSATDSFHSSISCLYQATKHVGGFVEWYTLYGNGQKQTNFLDTGLFIYLTPNVQLDCVFGSSVAASDQTLFTKFGFSTRW